MILDKACLGWRYGLNATHAQEGLVTLANKVLQQALHGSEPTLTSQDVAAAEGASNDLAANEKLFPTACPSKSQTNFTEYCPSDESTSALYALFSLALRHSAPLPTIEGTRSAYAVIRRVLCRKLTFAKHDIVSCGVSISQVLLGADVLRCYSHLFREAGDLLQPAVALHFPSQPESASSAAPSGGEPRQAAASTAATGHSGEQQPEQGACNCGEGAPQQPSRSPSPNPLLLCCELGDILAFLEASIILCRNPAVAAEVMINASGNTGSGVSRGGGGGGGGGGRGRATLTNDLKRRAREQLQSSWVLEHHARMLLLCSEGAIAAGDGQQCHEAQGVQLDLLQQLCGVLDTTEAGLRNLVRRPCGCALAATHMARVCAALDGGHAFGTVRPAQLLLHACRREDTGHLERPDPAALAYDASVRNLGRAVNLRPAADILQGWSELLREHVVVLPCGAGGTGPDGRGDSDAGDPAKGPTGASPAGNMAGAAELISRLPPHNRSATVTLCLRLAKGVLARWGGALPEGAQLYTLGSGSVGAPLLPKVGGCAVLYHALACSRLALLQAVRGREEVRGRTQAQLRAWWETYVAAVQHPEALAVGVPAKMPKPAERSIGKSHALLFQ